MHACVPWQSGIQISRGYIAVTSQTELNSEIISPRKREYYSKNEQFHASITGH